MFVSDPIMETVLFLNIICQQGSMFPRLHTILHLLLLFLLFLLEVGNGHSLNSDGSKLFLTIGGITAYNLSTAFDISSLSQIPSFSNSEHYVKSLGFNADGTKMFTIEENSSQMIHEYNLSQTVSGTAYASIGP